MRRAGQAGPWVAAAPLGRGRRWLPPRCRLAPCGRGCRVGGRGGPRGLALPTVVWVLPLLMLGPAGSVPTQRPLAPGTSGQKSPRAESGLPSCLASPRLSSPPGAPASHLGLPAAGSAAGAPCGRQVGVRDTAPASSPWAEATVGPGGAVTGSPSDPASSQFWSRGRGREET